jgi:DNA-binding MarR family transcriptional regulator
VRSARWPGGELRGYRAYVVAPGSIHPSGTRYKWANDGAEILRCDTPLPGVPWAYVERDRIPRLAAAIMRGDERVIKRYATRSEVDWALILSLTNAGASFERVKACYIASRHPKHLDPSRRDFDKRLLAEYLRAKEQGNRADYVAAREMAERVKAWAMSAEFVGVTPRTRETDRRVLIAHCDRAIKAGKSEWHMSLRDVEQAAQVNLMTASKATKRLIKAGLLKRSKLGFVGEYAQSYEWGALVSPVIHLHTLGGIVSKCIHGETANYASHPAFEHRGLGRHAGRIFETLARQGEATAKQLVALSGCTRATTYRYLKLMLKLQLVGYDPLRRIYWACPDMLDGIAHMFETKHIPALRRARIERDRAKFRRRLKRADQ